MPPAPPLLALREAEITFGGAPLFSNLNLGLAPGERTCLVGRNGCGKSSLLKALHGGLALDKGERFLQPGTRVAYLPQDPSSEDDQFKPGVDVHSYVTSGLPRDELDQAFKVDAILETLQLQPTADLNTLSGGEGRRVALAKALVSDPDVLLLDEPTNHLDVDTIEWLERLLEGYRGAILLISHDRSFLRRLARGTLWLDRGVLRRLDKGFDHFEAWTETIREQRPWPGISWTDRSRVRSIGDNAVSPGAGRATKAACGACKTYVKADASGLAPRIRRSSQCRTRKAPATW